MTSSISSRLKVLDAFKTLHKTAKYVFAGDPLALDKARLQINQEYKKYKAVDDTGAIEELVRLSKEVERELLTTVIQAKEVKPGQYEAIIREEIVRLDNVPYTECENLK